MKRAMVFFFLCVLLVSAATGRQTTDSLRTLQEVVVTATKFAKDPRETGKVLNVIDAKQLAKSNGKDLAQVLNEQAGVLITGANSNPGKEKFVFVRGASSGYTLILVDGIPMNDPSGLGGSFDLRLLPIDQIERIEILKGSQSTLYGSDAIAGVINIITRKANNTPVHTFGTLAYGSYRTLKASAALSGTTRALNYRTSYTRFQSGGISEAKDPANSFDRDSFHQNAFELMLEPAWPGDSDSPAKAVRLRPFIRYTDFDGQYDAGSFADDTVAVFKSQSLNYGLQGEYELSRGAVHVQYARTDTDRKYKDGYGTYPYHGSFDHAEVFINHDLGKTFQLLAGGSFQALRMDAVGGKRDPSFTIASPYASFFVKNIHGFSAEAGARYNRHSVFRNAFTYSINPSYLIRQRVKLFINHSTGFKSPTLNELYGPYGANEDLKPQTSTGTEGGLQLMFARLDVRATVFSRTIGDVIFYGTSGYVNLNQQSDQGLEFETTARLTENVTIRGYYAFVDGEVKTQGVSGNDTTYHNLLRVPKHTVGLYAGYQVTRALFVSANLKWVGRRKDSFFDASEFTIKSVTLDAYPLLDVYAEYSFFKNRLKMFADLKNVLDRDYEEVHGYSTLRINAMAGLVFNL